MLKSVRHDGIGIAALLAVAAVSIALATAAVAAPPDPRGDPDQFRRDIEALNKKALPEGESLAQAVGGAVDIDARLRGRCASKKFSLGPLEPVSLDGMITALIAQGQIENAWLVSVRLDDCPPADPIRVLLLRGPDGEKLQAIFAGQGESLTWPTLARDALRATVAKVVARLRVEDPRCAPPDLTQIGIRIASRSTDLGPNVYGLRLKGNWTELWAFAPCGHDVAVPISFTTDGQGGAYWSIDVSKIVYRP